MSITRRQTLILTAATGIAAALGAGSAHAQEGQYDQAKLLEVAIPDFVLGNPDAPVTMIEYASPTCPHCANFHRTLYPQIKAEYIDTGKVKFILRPFLLGGDQGRDTLDALVFTIAYVAGPESFHDVVAAYLGSQEQWFFADSRKAVMLGIAQQFGYTPESFDAALTNQDILNGILAIRQQAYTDFGVRGTPTFFINGKQFRGDTTFEQFKAEIDPLVPADFVPPAAAEAPAIVPETGGMAAEPVVPAQ